MLRCLTTINAYHRALHDYFAFACIGQPVDPLERAVALHFCEEALVDVAPEWAVEADDPDVLRDGIHNYTPDNPPDDSWMQDVPEDEQDWFRVCELIGLLTEYDDLSVVDTARQAMLKEGMTDEEIDHRLRNVIAPLARIAERELEILGVKGCETSIPVPADWSSAEETDDEGIATDLDELTLRLHDNEGQPVLEESSLGIDGRIVDLTVKASRPPRKQITSFVEVFRLADNSCHVRMAADGQAGFVRTPRATWGRLAHVDDLANAWGGLLSVQVSPYQQIEYEEVEEDADP